MSAARVIPILVYHRCPDDFADQVDCILKEGYEIVNLKDVQGYLENPDGIKFPEKKIVLTFDDAFQDFFKVKRILDRRGLGGKATICVPIIFVSLVPSARFGRRKSPTMIWEELEELVEAGYEIASHSVSHRPHDRFDYDEEILRYEIADSKDILEAKLGLENIQAYCFPGGAGWGKELINKVLEESGYTLALRAQYNGEPWDQYSIPRFTADNVAQLKELLTENLEHLRSAPHRFSRPSTVSQYSLAYNECRLCLFSVGRRSTKRSAACRSRVCDMVL